MQLMAWLSFYPKKQNGHGILAWARLWGMQFLEKNFVALTLLESSNNPESLLKLTAVARYITQSAKLPKAKFRDMIANLPPAKANVFKSTGDIILEEGIEIGIEKGR